MGLQTLCAALLAATLLELPKREYNRWRLNGGSMAGALALVLALGVLLVLLREWPASFSLACLACAGVAAAYGWRSEPAALILETAGRPAGEPAGWDLPAWGWLTAIRWSVGLAPMLGWIATVAGTALLQAVLGRYYGDDDESGLLMTPVVVYVMLAGLAVAGRFLHRLSPLPISKRRITAMIVLPVLAAAVAGYSIGFASRALLPSRLEVAYTAEPERAFPPVPRTRTMLRMPPHHFRISWDGRTPPLRAPWGEVHQPWQAKLWRGMDAVLYSPVSTAEPASPEFAAWEISRALELVYGIKAPHERIHAMYVGVDSGGRPVVKRDIGELLPAGAKPVSGLDWVVPPLTLGVCGAGFLGLTGLLMGLRRAATPTWRRTAAAGFAMGLLMLLYLIRVPLSLSGYTRGWIAGGAVASGVRSLSEAAPGGAVAFWALSAAGVFAAFEFAVRRMQRTEILPEPPKRLGF